MGTINKQEIIDRTTAHKKAALIAAMMSLNRPGGMLIAKKMTNALHALS